MLDYFAIFTKGGALLWTLQFTTAALKQSPVDALNALIRGCLLEERSATSTFTYTPKSGPAQSLKWTFHNGLGLVFVAVYQKALSLLYVEELLQRIKEAFVSQYDAECYKYSSFETTFQRILKDCEAKADAARRQPPPQQQNQHAAQPRGQQAANGKQHGRGAGGKGQPSSDEEDSEDGGAAGPQAGAAAGGGRSSDTAGSSEDETTTAAALGTSPGGGIDRAKLAAMARRKGPGGKRAVREEPAKDGKPAAKGTPEKKGKEARKWGLGSNKPDNSKLDFTEREEPRLVPVDAGAAALTGPSRMEVEDSDSDEEVEVEEAAASAGPAAPRGVLGSFMARISLGLKGKEALAASDLAEPLEDMKRKLMERNVAEEIAMQVCDSVAKSLVGKKLQGFTGIGRFVKDAFEDSLSRILNKRQVDVLHDIELCRKRGKPYVIVFCGVNGVGKSTNLAKICYWLGQHNFKVLLAACDTFRSGAVEQLQTHARRLGVPLYERGYEKDPAKVAHEAIKAAEREARDVVLVDTAGRMQDNEPLMRALSNLIHTNTPNLVLFVGEALVGNDAVDQLVKFNRALFDLAPPGTTRRQMIDGIVLTKFDTIDDKVGAAVSMVYASGAPVMFVGCGQTYVDLKKLHVKSVVNSLLK